MRCEVRVDYGKGKQSEVGDSYREQWLRVKGCR